MQLQSDHSLLMKALSNSFLAVLVYVDDIIIASNNQEDVDSLKEVLSEKFKMRYLGPLRFFRGLEVARSASCITIICNGAS